MTKKDRIAIVVSTLSLFFGALAALGDEGITLMFASIGVVLYWAYRFIKNDISFLNIKDD